MADPPDVLSYATPRPRRRRRPLAWADRPLARLQLAVGGLGFLLAMVGWAVGGVQFSEGPFVARVALAWVPTGAVALNLWAAVVALRGAGQVGADRDAPYHRYLWLVAANMLLTLAALAALNGWPVFVTDDPSAPAVNDYRLAFDGDWFMDVTVVMLACNPLAIALVVRRAVQWSVGTRATP